MPRVSVDRPGVHRSLVALQVSHASVKSSTDDGLRDLVSASTHSRRHAGDRRFGVWQAEEEKRHESAEKPFHEVAQARIAS